MLAGINSMGNMNNYCGNMVMGQQNPMAMMMLQMIEKMMDMIGGGEGCPMSGGMPSGCGMPPCGAPALGSNIGNFLGAEQQQQPGGLESGGFPRMLDMPASQEGGINLQPQPLDILGSIGANKGEIGTIGNPQELDILGSIGANKGEVGTIGNPQELDILGSIGANKGEVGTIGNPQELDILGSIGANKGQVGTIGNPQQLDILGSIGAKY
ncbi:MAG: hypothetical protein BWY64_03154 [bacterium ADurb.Bin363]|nr:MAG: hypothetical protein BWY64_03154 [bacterium ADurb.Bin363]